MFCSLRAFAAFLPCALMAVGCSGPKSKIHGTVTYQGVAVPNAMVIVLAADNQSYTATTGSDGRYELPGIPQGQIQIAVQGSQPNRPDGDKVKSSIDPTSRGLSTAEETRKGASPTGPPLPAKYLDPAQSGFTLTLTEPDQLFDIDLK